MQPAKTHRPHLLCKSGYCFSCFSLYLWTANSVSHILVSTCLLNINVTEKGHFTRKQKGWSPALGTRYLATHLIKYCPLQYFLQKHPLDKSICFIPKGFPAYWTAPSLQQSCICYFIHSEVCFLFHEPFCFSRVLSWHDLRLPHQPSKGEILLPFAIWARVQRIKSFTTQARHRIVFKKNTGNFFLCKHQNWDFTPSRT